GDLLGIIRSQELLAARRIDGGHQYFTRARDFGFSKTPEETLRFWDRDQVLSDAVRVIRQFQPDVVITRFPPDGSGTHGHHTASARIASEAVAAAGDPSRVPDSIKDAGPWRPKRFLWNTSSWFYDKPEEFHKEKLIAIDVGAFSPLLGESFTELAARSRSMHRSQGFGSGGTRGEVLEYLQPVAGESAKDDLLDGVDTTWGRVEGGKAVGAILGRAYRDVNPEDPSRSGPLLLRSRARRRALPAGRWTTVKQADLDQVIVACLGLFLEAAADTWSAVPGDKLKVNCEAANRSPLAVKVKRVTFAAANASAAANA